VGAKWYVLVVVDDYSRYAWVFFLEDKGETFGFVRDLVLRLRNERYRDAIRAIHSDNGSEFRNSRFETFCHDFGLEHQFSSPYTPPKNGVVERKNKTLCEMTRRMLDEHRTPKRYWAEVVNTACYVSNRIYLRRAYRVLNLETNQIMETCEVTFDEKQPCSQLVFECAGDDELGDEIFQEEEHELGDDEDGGVVPPAEHVPTTSTTVVDGPSPTPTTTNQDRGEAVVEEEVASRREPPR
jgi:hypothetical protein